MKSRCQFALCRTLIRLASCTLLVIILQGVAYCGGITISDRLDLISRVVRGARLNAISINSGVSRTHEFCSRENLSRSNQNYQSASASIVDVSFHGSRLRK